VTGPILFIFFFFVIPREADFWWAYALYGMAAGLLISWSAPCNNAILSDVFPEATFPLAYGAYPRPFTTCLPPPSYFTWTFLNARRRGAAS